MIEIQGASHYFHPVRSGEQLPSLDDRLRPLCREHFRRLDRFIELALLGSGECVAGRKITADCGLYISSGIGPIGSNIIVQDSVARDAKLPMPFNFVNTLGSSAGYYVGKNLGLSGEGIFVSRRGSAFAAALACAMADISAGLVSQILIGAVEECPPPVDRFREMVALPAAAVAAEGSHWLLLGRTTNTGSPISADDTSFEGYESSDAARLASFALGNRGTRFGLSFENGGAPALTAL